MTTIKHDAGTLLAMADHIEEVPGNRLDMERYWGTDGCGCILGHCVVAGLILGYTVKPLHLTDAKLQRDGKDARVEDVIADLGLPRGVERIFDSDHPLETSPDGAARLLRYVAKHGTHEGYVRMADA